LGFFRFDYNKAGAGVAKGAPRKKAFFAFWDIYFSKLWKFIKLNFITLLFCLPIITIGPALTGMTKVLRNFVLDKNSFVFHDFWKGFKQSFKKSLPIGMIDVIIAVSSILGLQIYPQMAQESQTGGLFFIALCVISLSFAFTLLMVNFYIFPMLAATDLSVKDILKNSFFLTCVSFKRNFITFLIVLFTSLILLFTFFMSPDVFLLILPVFPISFLGFVIMFNTYPQIQKYVINPYYEGRGEENPEYAHLKSAPDGNSLFVDKGGSETPIPKKSKGKTIS